MNGAAPKSYGRALETSPYASHRIGLVVDRRRSKKFVDVTKRKFRGHPSLVISTLTLTLLLRPYLSLPPLAPCEPKLCMWIARRIMAGRELFLSEGGMGRGHELGVSMGKCRWKWGFIWCDVFEYIYGHGGDDFGKTLCRVPVWVM